MSNKVTLKNKLKKVTLKDKLKKEIRDLKKEAKPFLAYKRLILNAAKSEYDPKDIVEGINFAAKQIEEKNYLMADKVGGTSGDLMVRDVCPKCEINLVGKDLQPREFTLPCLIKGCSFNEKPNQLKEKTI